LGESNLITSSSRTYQNSEQRHLDFLDFTLAPYMSAVESRLSMRDILPRGYQTRVNLDGFLRADTLNRMSAYKIGLDVKAYTYDEIRDLEDRPPLTPAQRAEGQPAPLTPPIPMPVKEMKP
jgi:phage portal protein BeeE